MAAHKLKNNFRIKKFNEAINDIIKGFNQHDKDVLRETVES